MNVLPVSEVNEWYPYFTLRINCEHDKNLCTDMLVAYMAQCMGELPVTAKVDTDMHQFLEAEARKHAVSRSELMRRILDTYRESRREQVDCPHCGDLVVMDVRAQS
jgi:phage terminase large subunit GpA-like protein